MNEITGWLKMDPASRWSVVQAAAARKASQPAVLLNPAPKP
jgi:predicted Fe-S protein YdhL (DUF1289 family)